MSEELSRETIITALGHLNAELGKREAHGEVCIFGGAAMVLAFQTRPTTRDVDAVFAPTAIIRDAANFVQKEMNLPENWLNDGVKGFLSPAGTTTEAGLPQFPNLRVTRPTAEYLLAMKALAARAAGPEGKGDRGDILTLLKHVEVQDPDAAFAIIQRFYPGHRILPKTEYLLRDIFDERASQEP